MDTEFTSIKGIPAGPLFHEAPNAISVQDRDLRILTANRRFHELFDARQGDYCYKVFKKLDEPCDDCPVMKTFEDGKTRREESTVTSRDGDELHVLVTTAPIRDSSGWITAVMETVVDITREKLLISELEKSKESFRKLFDEVPCYISVQDKDLRVVQANRRFSETFGDPMGRQCYQVYKKRSDPCLSCPVLRTFQDGESHSSEETVTGLDGSEISTLVQTSPIRNDQGETVAVMEMSTDITDFKKLQSRLASVGELVAGLAHTVKGIVQGLDGGMYVVDSGFESGNEDTVKKGWEMVQRNVERVSRMVLDILYYAKEREPDLARIKPAEMIREILELYNSRLKKRNIRVELELDDEASVLADSRAIHAMLVNLVENASDACKWDKAKTDHRIFLAVRNLTDQVEIEITDNGVGMDEKTLAKVFTPFYSTKKGTGTGLGLMVAHKVAEEHGGSISVRAAPGEGATFRILLPVREEPQNTPEEEPRQA